MSTTTQTTLLDSIDEFLRRYYREEIGQLAQSYPKEQTTLTIDYGDILHYDPDIADDVLEQPAETIRYFEEALGQFDLPLDIDLGRATVRVENFPETRTFDVGGYTSETIQQSIAIQGQVSKATEQQTIPVVAAFECQRCGTLTRIPQDGSDFQEPHECQGCERQGPFDLRKGDSEWRDIQVIRLQQPPEQTNGGSGSQIDAQLEDDLVGSVDPGDRIELGGVHDTKQQSNQQKDRFDHYLSAQYVDIQESDYHDIGVDEYRDTIHEFASGARGDPYDLLVESIAPSIIGMEELKLALALQMFGGVSAEQPDGTTKRGDIHILLLGDPGTAKSSLLEAIDDLAPCSAFASGKGATAAGMTASAVQDDFGGSSEWTLDAGAMVLADKGIACVDELDKVGEDVVSSLHQALSKQQIHINKAGINAHLPTRTAMLAAGNPKHGRFQSYQPIAEQIDLAPAIMSRFDLMYMLDDKPDREHDRAVVEGVLENRDQAIRYTRGDLSRDETDIEPAVPKDVLRAWVALAKQSTYPRWPAGEARASLQESFLELRMANGDDEDQPVPITYRALEAQNRLAEASARVRLSDTVEMQDVDRARTLYERYLRDVGIDPDSKQFDADIIETGRSKSQQDRIVSIRQIIGEHEGADPVPHDHVIDVAEEHGIETGDAEYTIEKLKTKGSIYEAEEGAYRTT